MFDVAVIGAGVVGGMIARTLSAYDLKICIVERKNDVATGASCANSAIVHAGFDAHEGSLKAKLNVRGSEMMAEVCRELGVKYKNNGSLVIGFNDEDKAEIENLYRRGVANGVKGLEVIDAAKLRELEPNISKNAVGALWAPTGAIVCPYELTIAAVGNAMDNGAELRLNSEVTAIADAGDHYVLTTAGGTLEATYIINAAGVYSDAVAKMVGDDSFTVHPRRGEYVLLDKESGGLVRHTIFRTPSKMGKGILVTPTVDGNLLTGPTSVDMTDKDDKSTTADGLGLVMKQASENVEGIRFNQTITSFCGLRAVGSTGDFIINMPRTRFVNVAGIESPGLSSAPAIAEYVEKLLLDAGLSAKKKADFNPTRPAYHAFREMSMEEKNEIIRRDPTYGKIICRCETVTEGDILDAIHSPIPAVTLDMVKSRLRAGMGRCQGGFCSPRVAALIAEETGVTLDKVTKKGGDSWLVEKKSAKLNRKKDESEENGNG